MKSWGINPPQRWGQKTIVRRCEKGGWIPMATLKNQGAPDKPNGPWTYFASHPDCHRALLQLEPQIRLKSRSSEVKNKKRVPNKYQISSLLRNRLHITDMKNGVASLPHKSFQTLRTTRNCNEIVHLDPTWRSFHALHAPPSRCSLRQVMAGPWKVGRPLPTSKKLMHHPAHPISCHHYDVHTTSVVCLVTNSSPRMFWERFGYRSAIVATQTLKGKAQTRWRTRASCRSWPKLGQAAERDTLPVSLFFELLGTQGKQPTWCKVNPWAHGEVDPPLDKSEAERPQHETHQQSARISAAARKDAPYPSDLNNKCATPKEKRFFLCVPYRFRRFHAKTNVRCAFQHI